MSTIIVHVRHIRAAKLCTRGMRAWLERHGFDLTHFVKNGLPIEIVEATGDALALRVCEEARKEAQQ